MGDNNTRIPDEELSTLTQTELIGRLRTARKIYRSHKDQIEELQHEVAKCNSAIEAYAKDNGILRSKIETLEERIREKDRETEALNDTLTSSEGGS